MAPDQKFEIYVKGRLVYVNVVETYNDVEPKVIKIRLYPHQTEKLVEALQVAAKAARDDGMLIVKVG